MLFGCLILGVLVTRFARPPDTMAQGLNWWILRIALPALILELLPRLQFSPDLWFAVATIWIAFCGAWLVFGLLGPQLGWSRQRTGALILVCGLGNTTFLGYPLVQALRGKEALGVAVVSDQLGSAIILITLAVVVASLYSGRNVRPRHILKNIATFPAFLALLLGIVINAAGGWPDVIHNALVPIGATLTPLALFSVGLRFKLSLGTSQQLGAACMGWGWKLLVAPALAWLLADIVGVTGVVFHVGVLQAGMAPMVSATILANDYELDPSLANTILGIGIILSLGTVPMWNALMGW